MSTERIGRAKVVVNAEFDGTSQRTRMPKQQFESTIGVQNTEPTQSQPNKCNTDAKKTNNDSKYNKNNKQIKTQQHCNNRSKAMTETSNNQPEQTNTQTNRQNDKQTKGIKRTSNEKNKHKDKTCRTTT